MEARKLEPITEFKEYKGRKPNKEKEIPALATETMDITCPKMLEDISDITGMETKVDAFHQILANLYMVAYIRGKQDIIRALQGAN